MYLCDACIYDPICKYNYDGNFQHGDCNLIEKQLYIQQLKIDEKQKLENLIQPQIEKLTKQKQEILKMIQKDPEQYQTENFKIKLSFEIKHKNSEYWQVYFLINCS